MEAAAADPQRGGASAEVGGAGKPVLAQLFLGDVLQRLVEYDVIEIAASELHDEGAMTRHFRRLAGYLREDAIRRALGSDTGWFRAPPREAGGRQDSRLRLVVPTEGSRFRTCVPLYSLMDEKKYMVMGKRCLKIP